MNKQQILRLARMTIDKRRFDAEDKADKTLNSLRQNQEWTQLERRLREAEVDSVMGGKDKTEEIASLKRQQEQLLKRLGLTKEDILPHYTCTKCNDTGYTGNALCQCLQDEIRRITVSQSNVLHQEYTFESSAETDKHNIAVYKKAKEICEKGKTNMLLIGNVGAGKTYLMTACANRCLSLGKNTLYLTAYSLGSELLNAHISGYALREETLDTLVGADVLLIDDLGTENIYKNVTAEYLYSVLNERIVRGNQTFISTNLTLQQLRERYDERIFSRLVDQNITLIAELVGKDKRLCK